MFYSYYKQQIDRARELEALILSFRTRLKDIELTDKGLVIETDDVGYQQDLIAFYDEHFRITNQRYGNS